MFRNGWRRNEGGTVAKAQKLTHKTEQANSAVVFPVVTVAPVAKQDEPKEPVAADPAVNKRSLASSVLHTAATRKLLESVRKKK